ncbi:MAG: NAD(P)/FAD-dependent oxidoreductase [Candidatus Nitrosopelagicus sp.]|nr:NAD(P)/FAD-dependent oxidoreductase [Candidatus Nitrosopelagicus sp.]
MYDAVVAGGSISGLLAAREIAKNGHSVLVLEEGFEVGSPEHCGGLVSKNALKELGIEPSQKTFDSEIECAKIFSPEGKEISINSKKQQIVVINRRELDKQAARQARDNGAQISVKTSFLEKNGNGVKTSNGDIECKFFIDCRGVSRLVNKDRDGILLTAQYEVYADWIKKGQVEVYFDQEKYPEFFAWVIPSGEGVGKIGVSGKGINTEARIDEFLKSKGDFSTIRKIFAPIWIKGPIKNFVEDDTLIVGDAAGQAKPTTAGGIFSCGMAGIMAGKAISEALKMGNSSLLINYEKQWKEKFGKEFEKQNLARKILSRLDNNTVNKLFNSITPEIEEDISNKEDFDFHTSSILRLLGMKGSFNTMQALIGGEIKRLVQNKA